MARRWPRPSPHEPAAKLHAFDPDDWILAARGNPARVQMALDRWHAARLEWCMEDPRNRTIDGMDVVDLIFEDEPA
jgi:hypothetical protein